MRFELTRGSKFVWGQDPPWQVERILIPGERYLVACFESRDDAVECMNVINRSIEVKRGATVNA